jgi:hypothetical protein
MERRSWIANLAAVGTLTFLSTLSFARPHTDPAHRSALPVWMTLADGTRHAATLQGVGCTESMCSRVRALDRQAESIWLDGLTCVRDISGSRSGPVHAMFVFKDGTERPASITETNRVLYLTDDRGRERRVDLTSLRRIDFK